MKVVPDRLYNSNCEVSGRISNFLEEMLIRKKIVEAGF